MEEVVFTLTPAEPYDFDLTVAYATYFRDDYGADTFHDGIFRRLLENKGRPCLVSVCSVGTIDTPRLEVKLSGSDSEDDTMTNAQRQVAWILGIDQDLLPFYSMAKGDPVLTPLVMGLRGLHIPHTATVYESLVLAIIGQQISSQVARHVRTLLIHTYGQSTEISGVCYYAFPVPEAFVAAGLEGLRAVKLSVRKAQYILDIAARIVSGELDLESLHACDPEEVIRRLTSIRGVGVWTAQWLLIRGLGYTDGFPLGDLALERTLGLLVNDDRPLQPDEALKYSQRWSPFRSYVTAYLFAAIRSGRFDNLFLRKLLCRGTPVARH